MKDKKNRVYESPSVEVIRVEVEGGVFIASPTGDDINDPTNGQHLDFEIW